MNRTLLGALGALLLVAIGVFWWQGRASSELVPRAAPPPEEVEFAQAGPLPTADVAGKRGPAPPEASEATREQLRFRRMDRNADGRVARDEMLSTRTAAFRKLDRDGNNLLTFEEWAVTTAQRFDQADADKDGELSQKEFATTAPKPAAACRC